MPSADVLLAEDNPGDVELTREAFRDINPDVRIHVASDGLAALAFLRREGGHERAPRPDLILLDLNMPRMDGREVLAEIKKDPHLRGIPVVVLTSSEAEKDIARCYSLDANCYVTKPVEWHEFVAIVEGIESFWLSPTRRAGRKRGE